ncbi:acyl-CoA dehydrogenase family protein [Candidatus Poriferisocius sp.]|uniref:acyl-CoA dehydrogenase family protein n=1 Tax=Candidatus Poriferisocius sp. TaxID=3101276 RepID=UPI003B0262EA
MRLTELRLGVELAGWRDGVRDFLRTEMAPGNVAGHIDPSDLTGLDRTFELRHQKEAARRGMLAVSLPIADGGRGRSRAWKHVFDLEAAYHGAPSMDTGVTLCGFVLSRFGTPDQKSRWLAPMVSGKMLGSIAYSEAGAGNNLAAISTRAVRNSNGWELSGTKSHVTGAHKADMAVVLAVTDPGGNPRSSMTMFLVPLDAPGVQVRRRPTLNRWTLGEIALHQVHLDTGCVLGEVGKGWSQVMSAVAAERGSPAYYGWVERGLERLPPEVTAPDRARLHAAATCVRAFCQRLVDFEETGRPVGYEASVVKVAATELLQTIARTALSAAGAEGFAWSPMFADGPPHYYDTLEAIHPTISVGANETHRDMIATTLLDHDPPSTSPLPEEPGQGSVHPSTSPIPAVTNKDPVVAACLAMAAQARRILTITTHHGLNRPLYGKVVGDFQTARHRFVDMAIAVEAMELTTMEVANTPPGPQRDYLLSAAKMVGNEHLLDIVAGAHQLHGADGYYADHLLAPYTEWAWAAQARAGTTAEHSKKLAALTR